MGCKPNWFMGTTTHKNGAAPMWIVMGNKGIVMSKTLLFFRGYSSPRVYGMTM